MITRRILPGALLALLAPAGASAQSGGWVALLGRDTVAVESYTWSGDTLLTGTNVVRTPRTMVRSYQMSFAPGGMPRRFHLEGARPGAAAVQEVIMEYGGDTVQVSVRRDTLARHYAVTGAGAATAVPFFEDIFEPWDVIVRHASGDSTALLAGRQLLRFGVARQPGGTRFTWSQWGTALVTTDGAGRASGLDLTATTSKYLVRPAPGIDVQALAMSFASRDLGELSPRDTARAQVAGANVLVDYSRPAARGRTLFGGVVPWGEVWRTGANAATQLVTDRTLEIEGISLPPGTYTLFSVPAHNGPWKLVINRQHGQWGTVYDPAQDVARVDLRTAHLAQPVERMTFEIAPAPGGGTLSFAWGDTRAWVPFKVK